MHKAIIGLAAALLATAGFAQVVDPLPGTAAAPDAAAAAEAQARAAQAQARERARVEEQERQARREREATEDRARDEQRQADKERKASEERIAAEQRATAAEEEKARRAAAATAAAAPRAPVAPVVAAPAAAAPVATSSDPRSAVTQICLAEARSRGKSRGVTDIMVRDVEDTDVKSDGRASVRADVSVVSASSGGKVKTDRKTMKCDTKRGVVTRLKIS